MAADFLEKSRYHKNSSHIKTVHAIAFSMVKFEKLIKFTTILTMHLYNSMATVISTDR